MPGWGTSNEYLQHIFLWRNKKSIITLLLKKKHFIWSYGQVMMGLSDRPFRTVSWETFVTACHNMCLQWENITRQKLPTWMILHWLSYTNDVLTHSMLGKFSADNILKISFFFLFFFFIFPRKNSKAYFFVWVGGGRGLGVFCFFLLFFFVICWICLVSGNGLNYPAWCINSFIAFFMFHTSIKEYYNCLLMLTRSTWFFSLALLHRMLQHKRMNFVIMSV